MKLNILCDNSNCEHRGEAPRCAKENMFRFCHFYTNRQVKGKETLDVHNVPSALEHLDNK